MPIDLIDVISAKNEGAFATFRDVAEEDLAFTVNATTGVDPSGLLKITRQSQITALGAPFATLAAVAAALPGTCSAVTITLSDETHVVTDRVLADWSHIQVTPPNRITITSASETVRASNAPLTYTIGSSSLNQITLSPDPGFTVDEFQNKFIRGVTGNVVGETKAIRFNTSAVFDLAGQFSGVPTGTVEVIEPACTIEMQVNSQMRGNTSFSTRNEQVEDDQVGRFIFRGIRFLRTGAAAKKELILSSIDVTFQLCFFDTVDIHVHNNSLVSLSTVSVDGAGSGNNECIQVTGSVLRVAGFGADTMPSVLIRGASLYGINILAIPPGAQPGQMVCSGKALAFDDLPFHAIIVIGGGIEFLAFEGFPVGSGIGTSGAPSFGGTFIALHQGGRCRLDKSDILSFPTGGTADYLLEGFNGGTGQTWATLNGLPSTTDTSDAGGAIITGQNF